MKDHHEDQIIIDFKEFLSDSGMKSKPISDYCSRLLRGFKLLDQSKALGKNIDDSFEALQKADENTKEDIINQVQSIACQEYKAKKMRSYNDVITSTRRFREFLTQNRNTSEIPDPTDEQKEIKKVVDKAAEKTDTYHHDSLMSIFMNRVNTWDRYLANGKCYPIRIYSHIFPRDKDIRGWKVEILNGIKFKTGKGNNDFLLLKDIEQLRINSSYQVMLKPFGSDQEVAAYTDVYLKSGEKQNPGLEIFTVRPDKMISDVSIDHLNPMAKLYYDPSKDRYVLPPQLDLLSQSVNDFIKERGITDKAEAASEYGESYSKIQGFDRNELKKELKDFFLIKMNDLQAMNAQQNSSKNDK